MNTRKALKGTVAAIIASATLFGFAGLANAADGQGVEQLKEHGAAQRIAGVYGNTKADNVILFIGDGMGDSEITVARNYLHGVNGSFDGLDKIGQPNLNKGVETGTGQYTTFSLGNSSNDSLMAKDKNGQLTGSKTAGVITPVTDSSASGSSWATGTKTYNNAVDVDVEGNPQLNLIELAKAAGKATGNVTTAEIQDATPAVLESHSSERACYGPQGKWDGSDKNGDGVVDLKDAEAAGIGSCLAPQLKANGGIGSISEQLIDTRADVTIGGGAKYFNQLNQSGETLWQQAANEGFQTVKSGDVDGFKALSYQENKPVLALLGDGNLPTQFQNTPALAQKETEARGPVDCKVSPDWLGNKGASLADFTDKAIDLLKANPKSKNGFFLQVEGASIDKQDHAANACGQIGETDDLDKAISAALNKVDLSNTLVIVTADHAHTSQIVSEPPAYALSTILKNRDGSQTVISYGTATANDPDAENPEVGYNDGGMEHTGTQLRIAASGPGASRVDGLTDQTDNFYTIAHALGLATEKADQDKLSDGASVTAKDNKNQVFDIAGFNGDAVLRYELKDKDGKVVSASDATTPLSGLRVKTAGVTTLDLSKFINSDAKYSLTVTGQQSGKTVEIKDFAGPNGTEGNGAAQVGPNASNDKPVASGKVNAPKQNGVLGKTGATVLGVALLAMALVAGGLAIKFAKSRNA
ncbi:alkaline phosphatase [Bifidobacterium sp. UTCIF-39]|uniref:alkaline phosphatase n=1 Tax=Bifidobacterium sp. UTCIF-39 TaxID=1465359 RepID=UPI0015E399EC|nr:alkaline phosphatase [Bifidobacterium sp. UTCIF-39]TPF96043.1 alkaline phosphatase [Bifidobacterium sp. UTCIF-39]